ncbi:hypothetical protein BX600DRAFT_439279 [Xylariales sp. PMI_506]|nr:hypothetical protein BX600DRAFT_439279 [Xylariales sp. PMI_506]
MNCYNDSMDLNPSGSPLANSPHASAEHSGAGSASPAKRRKTRKGTHSCWECKRRKMKCIFDTANDDIVCVGCRRRGSKCVSQEYPEMVSQHVDRNRRMGDRVVQMEVMIKKLAREVETAGLPRAAGAQSGVAIPTTQLRDDIPTPQSMRSEESPYSLVSSSLHLPDVSISPYGKEII